MIYMGMAVLIPALWFFPWWVTALVGALFGALHGPGQRSAAQFGLAAGLVWSAMSFVKDGQHAGLISDRLAGLFSLPAPGLIFVLVFVVAFVTAYLAFQVGAVLTRNWPL